MNGGGMFGPCLGGPYDGRPLVHHEPCFLVALEQTWRGRYVPIVGARLEIAQGRPEITFGAYTFDDGASQWIWHATAAISIRSAEKTL